MTKPNLMLFSLIYVHNIQFVLWKLYRKTYECTEFITGEKSLFFVIFKYEICFDTYIKKFQGAKLLFKAAEVGSISSSSDSTKDTPTYKSVMLGDPKTREKNLSLCTTWLEKWRKIKGQLLKWKFALSYFIQHMGQ